ncbi:lipopolysaccharide kinase InaA family protein, partial [Gemmatimonas sp.]|uniref:lipopolysaccharide kinase InaA family protein n=1 Tax=Gemmatimonas sp. TaxID=1962908 RepID=UPI00391F654D
MTMESAAVGVIPSRRATVHAAPSWLAPLVSLVEQHGTLYEWAASQPQPRALRGRAPVYVAPLPPEGPSVVVRHAWHGGLLSPLTRDVFRRPTRAPVEMANSRRLRELGVPTTEVIGFALYDAAMGLARVDVVTRYVRDTADLGMVLAGLAPAIDCDAALAATLDLLALLARHRVLHPDLNVKNILLETPAGGAARAMVLDVDGVTLGATCVRRTMARNGARLVRSLRKWEQQVGCELAELRCAAFAAAAGAC